MIRMDHLKIVCKSARMHGCNRNTFDIGKLTFVPDFVANLTPDNECVFRSMHSGFIFDSSEKKRKKRKKVAVWIILKTLKRI